MVLMPARTLLSSCRTRAEALACHRAPVRMQVLPEALLYRLSSNMLPIAGCHSVSLLLPQVYRAKERLDQDFRDQGIDVDAAEEAARAAKQAAEAAGGASSEQPGRQQQ